MRLDWARATYPRGPHTPALHVPKWSGARAIRLFFDSKLWSSQGTLNCLLISVRQMKQASVSVLTLNPLPRAHPERVG